MPHPPVLAVAGGAAAVGGVLVATAWVPAFDEASRTVTSLPGGTVPSAVLLTLLAVAALAPFGVLALADQRLTAAGLAVAAIATLLPLWAASPDLGARWRAAALAFGPLAVAGLSLMAGSRVGAVLATAAALLHALAYEPFRDVGCARACLETPTLLTMTTAWLVLLVALALTVAAFLAVASALRRGRGVWAAAGALALAGLAVVRWRTVGDAGVYADLMLVAVPVPGLVALPTLVAWLRTARRRWAVRRLARELSEDPQGLLELGADVDVSLLSAGQRLALQNARLAAESRARLAEVRASQRRVVAAADAERRRIERDLHDGAQQRLVGVLMQISGRGLDGVEDQIRDVLADLRSFSHGTFPSVLDEEGLAVALDELAATSDAVLRLDVRLDGPVPLEHSRAVYALVLRLAAGTIDVSVASRDGVVDVTVVGGPPADLSDVIDRFGALDGTLVVADRKVVGCLPCGS